MAYKMTPSSQYEMNIVSLKSLSFMLLNNATLQIDASSDLILIFRLILNFS